MPNYTLTVGSKFRPFEYQELIAPVLMATQAQQQLEDVYGELDTKASEWKAKTAGSEKARAQYEGFANALANEAEQLSKYGLTPASRQNMNKLRGRYASDIIPIETAYKKREAQAAAQQQALMQNPSLMFNRKASETNLDKYLENPDLGYSVQSGALLEKQVSEAAAALAKSARNDPNVQKTLMHKLLPYQYEMIRQSGFDPETVRATIMGTEGGSEILSNIVDNTLAASGMQDWDYASPQDKERILKEARSYANRGLWSAVGETKYDKITDEYGMKTALAAQELNNSIALARAKGEIKDGTQEEASRGWDFLETSGELQGYKDMQDNMFASNGALKRDYFGDKNNKFVNPIAVYEAVMKKHPKYNIKDDLTSAGNIFDLGVKALTNPLGAALFSTEAAVAGKAAYDYFKGNRDSYAKKQFGVNKLLSDDEYKKLKALGYTAKSSAADFRNGFSSRLDNLATKWRHGSVNLNEVALKERGNNLTDYFNYIMNNDITENQIWEMNSNGSLGKPIKSPSDVFNTTADGKLKDNSLTDVFYSRQQPDKIHITYGGKDVYVTPNAFRNSAISKIVNDSNQLLNASDLVIMNWARRMGVDTSRVSAEDIRNEIAKNTEKQLRDAMRSYNQGVPNTSSDLIN